MPDPTLYILIGLACILGWAAGAKPMKQNRRGFHHRGNRHTTVSKAKPEPPCVVFGRETGPILHQPMSESDKRRAKAMDKFREIL